MVEGTCSAVDQSALPDRIIVDAVVIVSVSLWWEITFLNSPTSLVFMYVKLTDVASCLMSAGINLTPDFNNRPV